MLSMTAPTRSLRWNSESCSNIPRFESVGGVGKPGGVGGLAERPAGDDGRRGALQPQPREVRPFRAGHAHAGVLVILSLVLQMALDHARLAATCGWAARVAAPLAAILVSGGFFGLAYSPAFRVLLYGGAAFAAYATLATGVGLLRAHE